MPYPGAVHADELRSFLSDGSRLSVDLNWPQLARDQMKACWKQDPHKRPTFDFMAVTFADAYKIMSSRRDKKRRSFNRLVSTNSVPHFYEYQSAIDVLHPQPQQQQHEQQREQQHEQQQEQQQQQQQQQQHVFDLPATPAFRTFSRFPSSSSNGSGSERAAHAGTPRLGVPMPSTPYAEMPGTPYTEIVTPLPKRQLRSISTAAVWEEAPVPASTMASTVMRTPQPRPIPLSNAFIQPNEHHTMFKIRSGSNRLNLFQSPGGEHTHVRSGRLPRDASRSSLGSESSTECKVPAEGWTGTGNRGNDIVRIQIDSPLSVHDVSRMHLASASTSDDFISKFPPLQMNRIFNTMSPITTQTLL